MIEQKRRETLEESLKALPIVEYQWMDAEELEFSQKVRYICRTECPRYGKSWSCPPAVGSVEECRKRCLEFQELFVFSTVAEVMDLENMEEVLKSKTGHERIIRKIRDIFRPYFGEILALSGDSCYICEACTYPEGACRHPEEMLPCIEGYGIVVPALAEKAGITFMNEGNLVTWFGVLLLKEKKREEKNA